MNNFLTELVHYVKVNRAEKNRVFAKLDFLNSTLLSGKYTPSNKYWAMALYGSENLQSQCNAFSLYL